MSAKFPGLALWIGAACMTASACVRSGYRESPCERVSCSGHGTCLVTPNGLPLCACDRGYRRAGDTVCALHQPDAGTVDVLRFDGSLDGQLRDRAVDAHAADLLDAGALDAAGAELARDAAGAADMIAAEVGIDAEVEDRAPPDLGDWPEAGVCQDGGTLGGLAYWTGAAADGRWSTAGNWLCDASPTASHVAVFDGRCGPRRACEVQIDVPADIAGLRLEPSFTGTLSQGSSQRLRIGADGWVQRGGFFAGGHADIDVNGEIWLEAGTLLSTTGTLSIGRQRATSNADGLRIVSGTYEHNGGTLRFDGAKTNQVYTDVAKIDVAGRLVLNDLAIDLYDPFRDQAYNGAILYIAPEDVVEVQGDLLVRDGKVRGGAIELKGDVVVDCPNPTAGVCAEGSMSRVILNGPRTQYYRGTYPGVAPFIVVDNPLGVEPATGVTDFAFWAVKVVRGHFVSPPGTWSFVCDREWPLPGGDPDEGLVVAGGNLDMQSTGITIEVANSIGNTNNRAFAIDVGTLDVPELSVWLDDYNVRGTDYPDFNNEHVAIAASTVLRVAGDFSFLDGRLEGGRIEVGGSLELACSEKRFCAGGGSTAIVLNGAAQTVRQGAALPFRAAFPGAQLTFAPPAAATTLSLLSDLVLGAPGQDLAILGGTLDTNGRPVTVSDTLILESGVTVLLRGASLTYGHLEDRGATIVP